MSIDDYASWASSDNRTARAWSAAIIRVDVVRNGGMSEVNGAATGQAHVDED